MCERKPLYNGLKIQIQDNQLKILDKSGHNIVNRIKKLKTAGSYASVFIVDCVTGRDNFSVVVKKQDSSKSDKRSGLKYEKMIYDLITNHYKPDRYNMFLESIKQTEDTRKC